MTLHWWMHWFWVTLWFFTCVINAVPLLSTIDSISATLSVEEGSSTTQTSSHTPSTRNDYSDSTSRQNFRIPKAIGINPTPSGIADKIKLNPNPQFSKQNAEQGLENNKTNGENDNKNRNSVLKIKNESQSSSSVDGSINFNNNNNNNNNDSNSNNNNNSNSVMKDSKVTWIFTGNKTSDIPVKILDGDQYRRNFSINDDQNNDDLAVLPLGEPTPTRFKLVLNKTNKFIPSNILNGDRIFNKSDDVEISDDLVEPRILATAASILQGISESPRLSRARSAFPSDYQQDQQDKKDEIDFGNATSSAVDIAAVTGSCLATIVLIGTMGSLGFVMYRRRYLNPPQTLNSDKCSNPDSSGYIDDSTIRDNSEEMYSLDNDSFLNSLEAMTIQNYWTDSVKHTKLTADASDNKMELNSINSIFNWTFGQLPNR